MCGMWHALCSTTCCSTKCCNVNCSANLADVQSHVIAVLSVPVLVLGTVLERSAAAFEHRNHPPLICHDDGCGWWTPQSQRLESVWFSPNFIWMSQTASSPGSPVHSNWVYRSPCICSVQLKTNIETFDHKAFKAVDLLYLYSVLAGW